MNFYLQLERRALDDDGENSIKFRSQKGHTLPEGMFQIMIK
jgi:hypothetical protein